MTADSPVTIPLKIFLTKSLGLAAMRLYAVLRADPRITVEQAANLLDLDPGYVETVCKKLVRDRVVGVRTEVIGTEHYRTYFFPDDPPPADLAKTA